MSCVVTLVVDGDEPLAVSTAVSRSAEAALRFHIKGEPAEVSIRTDDVPTLIRELLAAAQQLCDKAVAADVMLPGGGWGRASLLLDDALVAIAQAGESNG
jgi:hypothetical protein